MTRRVHATLFVLAACMGTLLTWLAWRRYATYHNETFDLALYTRMAWGLAHGDWWVPIVGADLRGIHLSPVLAPLGLLGRLASTAPVLLASQVAVAMATAWPIAKMGQQRFGQEGAIAGALTWLLQPNLGHVLTYEFHPGSLAVLPLVWGLYALDRRDPKGLFLSVVAVLFCREDAALVTTMLGAVAFASGPPMRRVGIFVAVGSLAYFLIFAAAILPSYAPTESSVAAHYGHWGSTLGAVALAMVSSPVRVFDHVTDPKAVLYLACLLAPVAFLPLCKPRYLFLLAAPLAMNLLSRWPTATSATSHYQTLLIPVFVVAALDGAACLKARLRRPGLHLLVLASGLAHLSSGSTPLSLDFDRGPFEPDERTAAAAAILGAIPAHASVQAPYALLPHLAERTKVHVAPPPERGTDFVVLDAWHRTAWQGRETLLRTTEEPIVRAWLAREDYGLLATAGPYLLLGRGAPTRGGPVARYFTGTARRPDTGTRLSDCMSLRNTWVEADELVLELVARGPCPEDLAIRIGSLHRPARVDFLFDGLLSPAQLRRGDRVVSRHRFDRSDAERWRRFGVRIGLIRSSGARPEPADPLSVPLPRVTEALGRALRPAGVGSGA